MINRFCLILACTLWAQSALAGAREDARAAEQRCSAIRDDRTWLECSYGALQIMRAKLGLSPAPEYQQRLVPMEPHVYAPDTPIGPPVSPVTAPSATPHAALSSPPGVHRRGTFMQILEGRAPPATISSLASVRYDNQGAFIVTLENGQVWRQMNTESAPKPHFRIGEKITIRPGALWSYNLETEDAHIYKVGRTS